jgi:hypothetical protein
MLLRGKRGPEGKTRDTEKKRLDSGVRNETRAIQRTERQMISKKQEMEIRLTKDRKARMKGNAKFCRNPACHNPAAAIQLAELFSQRSIDHPKDVTTNSIPRTLVRGRLCERNHYPTRLSKSPD